MTQPHRHKFTVPKPKAPDLAAAREWSTGKGQNIMVWQWIYIYTYIYIYNRIYIYTYIYNRTYIYILRTILIYTNWMSYIHFWELTRHVYFDIYIYNTQHIWYEGYTTIIWYIYWVVRNGVCHGIPVSPSNGIFNGASSSYFQTNSILQRT